MRRSILTVLAVMFLLGAMGVGYADTISGKVKEIDTTENSITLVSKPGETAAMPVEYKLVWDAKLPDSARLETAHVGEFLSVDAERNPVTQNWKVTTVRGPLAAVENAVSSDERMIEGKIRDLDTHDNSLVLVSTEADVSGKIIEYHVVWDDSNTNVRNRLAKAKIGDKLSLVADQNKITRNWKANSIVGPIRELIHVDVKTITGEVKSIEPAEHYLTLRTTDASGKTVDRKIVWDKNFADKAKLENMRVGDRLSVRANQNMLTRNWKVKALGK